MANREGIEGTAELLLRAAGLSLSAAPDPDQLVHRLLGGPARAVPPYVLRRDGALARVGATWCVFLRADLPASKRAFTLLHEIGHWAIGAEASEEECDALAAAMLAPRKAFLDALRTDGRGLARLAQRFATSESCVALRLGEATGKPLALVTPTSVRLRGASHDWPNERRLRELAERRRPMGLRKCRLLDEPGRTMLVATDSSA
jgi:hypothetical protein